MREFSIIVLLCLSPTITNNNNYCDLNNNNDLKLYSRSEKGLDSLVQTGMDVGMDFRIEKCAMLVMEKGKIVKSVGIELPDGKVIKSLQEGESYKYLEILEAEKVLEEKMKLNVSKEYIRRLRKVLQSKLNSENLVRGVNI